MFDRGFTGHEHLYAFGLINMNGRMYDPLLSSFLSPDNYMQDPTSQQGFNRYAYCMYNPLKYVDPSGELCRGWGSSTYYLEMAFKNMMKERYSQYLELMEMTLNHINEMIDGFFSMGNMTGGMLSSNHGNGSGNHGSAIGGGSTISNKEFIKKCHELGIESGQHIPEEKRNDAFLKKFQETFFPDMPMDYILNFSIDGYPFDGVNGVTQAEWIRDDNNVILSGYSCVYLNPDHVFENPENMFYDMGHEFVHVSQIHELMGCDYTFINDPIIKNIFEEHARSWNRDMGDFLMYIAPDSYYHDNEYYNRLCYQNFFWLIHLIHP